MDGEDRLREFIQMCEEATERDFEGRDIATPYALARIALALEGIQGLLEMRPGTSVLDDR